MHRRTIATALALTLFAALAGVNLLRPTPVLDLPMPEMIAVVGGATQISARPTTSVDGMTALEPLVIGVAQRSAQGWLHEWPALQWHARFSGTGLSLLFDDPHNRFRLSVDGTQVAELTRPGRRVVDLSGLAPGPHEVALEKFSESPGPARFGGFFLPPGATALPAPAPPARLIEFIGDSDTVGYANTSDRRICTPDAVFLSTDTGASFGPRAATEIGAGYRLIARSGIGLVRNYDAADPGRTMASLYPSKPGRPQPWAIVIGLGSNDFATVPRPDERWPDTAALRIDFTGALVGFVRQRHAAAPEARIVLVAFTEYGPDIRKAHEDAVAELARGGIDTTLILLPKLDRDACDWHPSPKDHAMIARKLIVALDEFPDR